MPLVGRAQEQRRGVDRAARRHDDIGGDDFFCAMMLHGNAGDFTAGCARQESRDAGIAQQGDIGVGQSRVDADDLRIAFRLNQAREPIAGVATDASAVVRVGLVEHDAERHVKRAQPVPGQIVVEALNPRLVLHGGERIRCTRPRLGRVDAARAVHVVQILGPGVVRLEVVVADRPGRRDPAVVANLTEVLLAEAEQRRPVEFRVAADVIVGVWVKRLAVPVAPHFLGVVSGFDVDCARAPVVFLPPT